MKCPKMPVHRRWLVIYAGTERALLSIWKQQKALEVGRFFFNHWNLSQGLKTNHCFVNHLLAQNDFWTLVWVCKVGSDIFPCHCNWALMADEKPKTCVVSYANAWEIGVFKKFLLLSSVSIQTAKSSNPTYISKRLQILFLIRHHGICGLLDKCWVLELSSYKIVTNHFGDNPSATMPANMALHRSCILIGSRTLVITTVAPEFSIFLTVNRNISRCKGKYDCRLADCNTGVTCWLGWEASLAERTNVGRHGEKISQQVMVRKKERIYIVRYWYPEYTTKQINHLALFNRER